MPWRACEPGVTRVAWDIETPVLHLNDARVEPSAVFGRRSVFDSDAACCDGYHSALRAWAEATGTPFWPSVPAAPCKVRNLLAAKGCGLRIPRTAISTESIAGGIAKPVPGGDYTRQLPEGEKMPWGVGFAQQLLKGPEYRVFYVAGIFVSFRVQSSAMDYRTDSNASLVPADVDHGVLRSLAKLADSLGYNFCASDLRCDESGLVFLEINSSPMFSVADAVCGGKITDALIDGLLASESNTHVHSVDPKP